jgi:hypothetical protein
LSTKLAIVAALVIVAALGIIQTVMAKGTPYQAGYDHGCDDAKISNADARYINQPDRGPSNHTPEFMSGYDAGFSSCGGSSGGEHSTDNSDGGDLSNRKAATGSSEFDSGYRAGVAKGAEDAANFGTNGNGVDANNPPPCPITDNKPYCDGWEKGYADKVVDDLE